MPQAISPTGLGATRSTGPCPRGRPHDDVVARGDETQQLMTIGTFARMAQLSPKALRLYDELGLLTPAAVDSHSGYRYYRPAQLERARLISLLRRLGLPLAAIGAVLDLPPREAAAVVEAHRTHLAAQTAERERLAALVIDQLTGGHRAPAGPGASGTESAAGLRYASRTSPGLVRRTNEDVAYAGPHVLAVADGVSGPAGRAASTAAVGALLGWRPTGAVLESLAATVRSVQQAVRGVAAQGEAVTTLTALLRAGTDRVVVVHIGDTRAYVLRRGTLVQLTRDHTRVQSLVDEGVLAPEEAAAHPERALLTRALTASGHDLPDVSTHDVVPGDRYLLASDGLTAVVPTSGLRDMLATVTEPHDAVDALVAAAHEAGAPDNIACVIADVVTP
ncbi:MAG: MerR family transcriptional regulator [Micromonosporaceae bacterium]|nr:MerR family transcriptional regulator [Micromonosporaceae bacterium]